MAIGKLKSRSDFADYCLRKLGAPVIQINIDEEQVEDAIDDALDKFWEYHADGSTQVFRKVEITQEIKDSGSFPIPPDTLNVIRVLQLGGVSGGSGIANYNNLQYQAYWSDVISSIPFHGISTFVITQSYLNLINDVFDAEPLIEYNKHQDTLQIQGGLENLSVGNFIVYEAVVINDPNVNKETWNNWWLKNYATALIQKQWGANITKYSNVTLPGGVVLNGDSIKSEAIAQIADLEERLRNEFQLPPDIHWG